MSVAFYHGILGKKDYRNIILRLSTFRAINNWYSLVKTSSLSKTQRRQLQKDVQDRFQVKTVVECCFCLVVFRWLGWIFQGQYLPSLSISYVAIHKDMVKRLAQLYQTKMKICYELCYVLLTTCSGIFSPQLLTGACFSNTCLNIREVWAKSMRAFPRYFGIKFIRVEIYTKNWTILIFGRCL